jgi:hypothetical protein
VTAATWGARHYPAYVRKLLAAAALLLATQLAGATERIETLVVDGKQTAVSVRSVVGEDGPRPDDVLEVGGLLLLRGETTKPQFRVAGDEVHELASDGSSLLVALRMRRVVDLAPSALVQPVPDVDLERCVVSTSTTDPDELAALPADVRFLSIGGGGLGDAVDELARLRRLRYLRIPAPHAMFDEAKASPVAALSGLTCLVAPGRVWDDVAALGRLTQLRSLDLSRGRSFTDVAFASSLRELRRLDVGRTWVTDMSAVSGLPHLAWIRASYTPLGALPTTASLRSLDVSFTRVPEGDVAAFRDAHREGAVAADASRTPALAGLAGMDGVRLRTGGRCHRGRDERVLWTSVGADDVRAVVDLLRFQDPPMEGRCMCCGSPTIEFLRGETVVRSVTVHHGAFLDFEGLPTYVELTPDGADALCRWITERGLPVESPREQHARETAESQARDAAQDAILGAERAAALREAKSDAAPTLFRAWFPDRAERLTTLIRLAPLRGGEGDGAHVGRVALDLLATEESGDLAARLAAMVDRQEDCGAAADAVAGLDTDTGSFAPALRIAAARVLLRLGRTYRAVELLARAGTPEATALVAALLPAQDEEGIPVRPPTDDEMGYAREIVNVADLPLLARLRRLALAHEWPDRWLPAIDRAIARRANE